VSVAVVPQRVAFREPAKMVLVIKLFLPITRARATSITGSIEASELAALLKIL